MNPDRNADYAPVVVVIGCDVIGSAVAHALHRCRFAVVLIDTADPPWPRRGMSYADAWYVGGATLEGVDACFCASIKSIPSVLRRRDMIVASTWSLPGVAAALGPVAVVDARSRSVIVSVARLATFEQRVVIAADDIPGGGACVDAPVAGRFRTRRQIAERVEAGEFLGELGGSAIVAPAAGVLRGLTARGARVLAGQMIAEIDRSGEAQRCYGIDTRARGVGARVSLALKAARRSLPGDIVMRAPASTDGPAPPIPSALSPAGAPSADSRAATPR
jgi:hypothetical protein